MLLQPVLSLLRRVRGRSILLENKLIVQYAATILYKLRKKLASVELSINLGLFRNKMELTLSLKANACRHHHPMTELSPLSYQSLRGNITLSPCRPDPRRGAATVRWWIQINTLLIREKCALQLLQTYAS